MPLDRLSDLLSTDDEGNDGTVVLYECRHCGTKFEKLPKRCSVCDTTEIAAYEFEIEEETDEHDDQTGADEHDGDGAPDGHDGGGEPDERGGNASRDGIEATRAGPDELEAGDETDEQ